MDCINIEKQKEEEKFKNILEVKKEIAENYKLGIKYYIEIQNKLNKI